MTTHEGTHVVKMSELRELNIDLGILLCLILNFSDNENDFYAKLKDTVNTSFNPGEGDKFEDFQENSNISFRKFQLKVTIIEKNKDVDKLKLDEYLVSQ